MKHFISYPFWINEVACWSDLKSLNGPVGTENRGVAVFTHQDITQLNESTFVRVTIFSRLKTKQNVMKKAKYSLFHWLERNCFEKW